jgi:hypothetical protein
VSLSEDQRSPLPYVAAAGMLLAAILLRATVEPPPPASRDTIERYLRHELDARVGAVLAWENDRRSAIEALADDEAVREGLASWAARSPDRDRALAHACRELEGCVVARPDGSVLAATDGEPVPGGLIAAAVRGRTVQSHLVPARGAHRYAIFFATPIVEAGEVRGVLAGRVRPHEELGAILGAHPPGRTGETYAVDRQGFMLTRGRFEPGGEPHRVERLLRAPLRSNVGAPLVLPRSGSDVDGYLDYRGVRVVGAWRWLEELGASVITEMDASEAYYTLAAR